MENKQIHALFLDDERSPNDVYWLNYKIIESEQNKNIKWEIIRTPEDFKKKILECEFDLYSFDHDLGVETTGYDLLKDLVNYLLDNPGGKIPTILFHSKNSVGVRNMDAYWRNALNHL